MLSIRFLVNWDNVHMIEKGMNKDQLYNLIGRPHFGEGYLACVNGIMCSVIVKAANTKVYNIKFYSIQYERTKLLLVSKQFVTVTLLTL